MKRPGPASREFFTGARDIYRDHLRYFVHFHTKNRSIFKDFVKFNKIYRGREGLSGPTEPGLKLTPLEALGLRLG